MAQDLLGRHQVDVPPAVIERMSDLQLRTGHSEETVFVTAVVLTLMRYGPDETANLFIANLEGTSANESRRSIALSCRATSTVRDIMDRAHGAMTGGRVFAETAGSSALHGPRSPFPDHDVFLTDSIRVLAALSAAPKPSHDSQLARLVAFVARNSADYALLFKCGESPTLEVRYRLGVLAPKLAAQFAEHVLQSALGMSHAMDRSAGSCPMLTGPQSQKLLEAARGPARDYPLQGGLRALFERQAHAKADSVAVIDEDGGRKRSVTYGDLDRLASDVANGLCAAGAKRGASVAVFLERSIEAVAAIVAIIKSGAIYVPIDVSYPTAYIRQILEETKPVAVLTDAGGVERLTHLSVHEPLLTVAWDGPSEGSIPRAKQPRPWDAADEGDDADSLFLTLYTSGSTGQPKGVVHRQLQVLNRLHWMWEAYPFGDHEVMGQRCPIGVMPSIWELLGGLLGGVPTAIASREVTRDPVRLADFIAAHKITRMTINSSSFSRLAATTNANERLTSLRRVIIGGEMFTPEFYDVFRRTLPDCVMIEDYGCTESNTVWHYALAPHDDRAGSCPGGRPIANVGAYILDRYGEIAPNGAVGELAVAGVSLAVAYIGKPEQYGRSFAANTVDPAMGKTLYRTGDLAYRLLDGSIRLIGRSDQQIKVRGMRVEPSEVESAISEHDDVDSCCVTTSLDRYGGGQLVAYVVRRPARQTRGSEIREFVAQRLPSFMVPTRVVFSESLPRLPNGKLDRRSLAQNTGATPTAPARTASTAETIKYLRGVLSALLPQMLDSASDDLEFSLLGLDSVTAIEFAERLSSELQQQITPTAIYDHHSLASLAAYLTKDVPVQSVLPRTAGPAADNAANLARSLAAVSPTDIAIIGMACRMPDADTKEQFWSNLAAGRCSIVELPNDRWLMQGFYSSDSRNRNASISKWCAFLTDIRAFDPLFFGISPADAKVLDPQIRIGLEEAWHAFEDSGYGPATLANDSVGIFVGIRKGDLDRLVDRTKLAPSAATLLGNDPSMLAGRIAYRMDLKGPSVTVDTACSSSMTAVHLACQSIISGECSVALAGGVCIVLSPDFYIATSRLGIFSPTGRSRPFDRDADGTVQGEGAGFLVLKRLERALEDGDNIYAVIKGTGIGQDGRTNGIGAPSARAQAAIQRRVYNRFALDPQTISYVEAHGTGTQIGDPIEIEALAKSFGAVAAGKQFCAIGSAKTNIGHLNAAAGIAGLIKTVLCLKHRRIPPSLGFEHPSPRVDFTNTPFYVNDRLQEWRHDMDMPLRAAVNSFGMSGTGGHCVLQEAPPAPAAVQQELPGHLFFFSAQTADALNKIVSAFGAWLDGEGRHHALLDISFTLLLGREWHQIGAFAVASSHDELRRAVADLGASIAAGREHPQSPAVPFDADTIAGFGDHVVSQLLSMELDSVQFRKSLTVLGQILLQSRALDVTPLFRNTGARRVSLPGYPFQKLTCWPSDDLLTPSSGWVSTDPRALPNLEPGLASDRPSEGCREQPAVLPLDPTSCLHDGAVPVEAALDQGNAAISRSVVRDSVAKLIGIAAPELDEDTALTQYGFDSIAAIDLRTELERLLGADVPMNIMTGEFSLGELMTRLDDFSRGVMIGSKATIQPRAPAEQALSNEAFPLTDLQAAYFFAKVQEPQGVGCHTYLEFEVADLDHARLVAAWNKLVAHHSMLRARITARGKQIIDPTVPAYVIKEYGPWGPAEFQAHVEDVRREIAQKVYSAETWPLFDLRVSRRSDQSAILHVSMDSWIIDGPSADILYEDLYALYADSGTALDAPAFEFGDFVRQLHERRRSEAGLRQREFWRSKLSGSPPGPQFPKRAPLPSVVARFQRQYCRIDAASWNAIKDFSARHNVFTAGVVLACFARSLSSALGVRRFSIVLSHSHRARFESRDSRVVGPFTSASLCVVENGEAPITDLAKSLNGQICENLDNPDVCIAGVLGEQLRHSGVQPSLPVVFTAQLGSGPGRDPRRRSWLDRVAYAVSQTPGVVLENRVSLIDDGIEIAWNFAESHLSAELSRTMLKDFEARLQSIAALNTQRHAVQLSPLQRVYMAERVRPDRGPWSEGVVYQELDVSVLDQGRFQRAFSSLLNFEPILATGLRSVVPVEAAPKTRRVQVEDLSLAGPEVADQRIDQIRKSMLSTCAQAEHLPPLRARVTILSEKRTRVHVATDMLAADAYSVFLVYKRLFELYDGNRARPCLSAPAARPQNSDFDRDYWIQKVQAAPPGARLPSAAGQAEDSLLPSARLVWASGLWPTLRRRAADGRVCPEAIMGAALNSVLRSRIGSGDFTTIVAMAGRDRVSAPSDMTIGEFTKLAWITEPRESVSFDDRVQLIDAAIRRDLERVGSSPIEAVLQLGSEARVRVVPPRIVMTSCLTDSPLEWPSNVEYGFGVSLTPHVDLDCCISNVGGRLTVHWDYRVAAFSGSLIREVFDDYCSFVERLLSNPAAARTAEATVALGEAV